MSARAEKLSSASHHSRKRFILFRRKRYLLLTLIVLIVLLLIAARIYLGVWLLNYVNRVINTIPGYQGSVESIDIELYRGAYRIHNLEINKKTGKIPTPFIDIKQIDFSIQWGALLRGRIVSDIDLEQPILNFAVGKTGMVKQTGAEVDWNKPIRDLMPIDINLVMFRNGKLSYQDFSTSPKVNVYIHHMHGEMRNLRNVEDASKALPSTIQVNGDSLGNGKLALKGRMNVLKPVPDLDLDAKLENANLAAFSNYTEAYAGIDIEEGKISVYSELKVKDNRVSGYVKPLATNVSIIDLRDTNPIKLAWETVVAFFVSVFTNHRLDQFATQVPIEGKLDNISTDGWAAIGGIIRNAFVEAFRKGVDGSVKY